LHSHQSLNNASYIIFKIKKDEGNGKQKSGGSEKPKSSLVEQFSDRWRSNQPNLKRRRSHNKFWWQNMEMVV
jgi:hypothetical protein